MKNTLKTIVTVLIVGISVIGTANAQHSTRPLAQRTYKGCGLFSIDVQNETDSQTIKDNAYTAVFGNIDEARKIFRNDLVKRGIGWQQIMDVQANWIKSQLGGTFDPSNPDRHTVSFESHEKEYWTDPNGYDDGYFIPEQGTNFTFCDPTTSSAHWDRGTWIVMVIKDKTNGLSVRILANCGNPILPKGNGYDESVTKTTYAKNAPAGSNTNINIIKIEQPKSLVYRKQPSEFDEQVASRNTGFPTIAKVGIGLVVVAALVKFVVIPAINNHKDNKYNNGFQGGSGQTTTTGGTGSGGTW